jgi:anti-sigma factor RsiW
MPGEDQVTDEMLVAHADGELPAEAARRVEAALAADPALASRYAALAGAGRAARTAFAATAREPVPGRLLAAVLAADAATAAPPPVPANAHGARRRLMAVAAALVLGIGLGVLSGPLLRGGAGEEGLASLPPSVIAALSAGASGERVEMPGAPAVTVLSTHRSGDGTICRAIDVGGEAPAAALACRATGGWRLVALVGRTPEAGGPYRPASDLHPLLQEVLDARGAGPALGAGEEAALRARGW